MKIFTITISLIAIGISFFTLYKFITDPIKKYVLEMSELRKEYTECGTQMKGMADQLELWQNHELRGINNQIASTSQMVEDIHMRFYPPIK